MHNLSSPILSVIICTANRENYLRTCLTSLLNQSLSDILYEIIIINNVPNEDVSVRKVIEDLGLSGKVIYAIEPKEGLSFARNLGLSLAHGNILAFIDDDAVADKYWLEEILGVYKKYPDAVVVGGKIQLFWEGDVPEWLDPELFSYLGELNYGEVTFPIQESQRLGGGNFSILKEWLERCNGFSKRLGRDRKSLLSGEEIELLIRIRTLGGKCYYAPKALVLHPAALYRMNKKFFRHRAFWGARSTARITYLHCSSIARVQMLNGMLLRFPYHFGRSIIFRICKQPALSFLWEIYCWHTVGYLVEVLAKRS